MTVQANIEAKNTAWQKLIAHPMARSVEVEGDTILIVYPEGSTPVDGIRTLNTADGIRKALVKMEQHWKDSLPCHK